MNKHGNLSFKWVDDLFITEAKGSFNEEGTEAAMRQFKESVLNSGLSSWYRLENWSDAMGTPEASELIPEFYNWSEKQGCLATAVVVTNSLQERIIKDKLSDYVQVFRDKEQAMAWLKKQRC